MAAIVVAAGTVTNDLELRGRLRAALCGEDPAFQRVIKLRGAAGSSKTDLLRATADMTPHDTSVGSGPVSGVG